MKQTLDEVIEALEQVYVRAENNIVEINPEYIYMTIPADYVCTYVKILILMADYGISMLADCQAGCSNQNKSIINCFNMFNAAVAARKLGQDAAAATIIKYVNAQLKIVSNGNLSVPQIVFPVDENGYLKAMIACGENPKFEIDINSGELLQKSISKIDAVYALDETDKATDESTDEEDND